MSKQAFDPPEVIVGQARVECRVAIWMRCPLCHQEHGHILTARDHPNVSGLRYWRVECQGASYFVRLSSETIATALAKAMAISAERELSQYWLSDENYERHCTGSGAD
jgi:hypothetical protein